MQQWGKTREPPGAKAPAARLCYSRVDWLLNPHPIWHKIVSVVFHGLFQLLPAARAGFAIGPNAVVAWRGARAIKRSKSWPLARLTTGQSGQANASRETAQNHSLWSTM